MDEELSRIANSLAQINGIDIYCYDELFLKRAIENRIKNSESESINRYAELLLNDKTEYKNLLSQLNITFSEFFRNPYTFEVIAQVILPAILKRKKALRIWSAACAGGHEPYSIAIVCDEIIGNSDYKPAIRLFATDKNKAELQRAEAGIYNENALGNVSIRRLRKYFTADDDKYKVIPGLQSVIDFSEFDLLNGDNNVPPTSIYGDFDMVFCSNLLFYYKPQCRQHILKKISASIAPGGFLVTGETERGFINEKEFREVIKFSAVFRKM